MGYIQPTRTPYRIEAKTVEVTPDENGIVTINFETEFTNPPIVTVTPHAFKRTVDTTEVTYYPKATIIEVTNTYVKLQIDVGALSYGPDSTASYYVGQGTSSVVSSVSTSTDTFLYDISYSTTTVRSIDVISKDSAVTSISEYKRSAYSADYYAYWRLVDDPTSEPDTGCYAFCDYTAKQYYLYSGSSSKKSWLYDISPSTKDFVYDIDYTSKSVVSSITEYTDYAVVDVSTSTVSVVGSPTTYDIPASDHCHVCQADSGSIIYYTDTPVKISYIAIEIL